MIGCVVGAVLFLAGTFTATYFPSASDIATGRRLVLIALPVFLGTPAIMAATTRSKGWIRFLAALTVPTGVMWLYILYSLNHQLPT